jgi:branched-chain amino acid transport system substrate-binding protein
MRILEGRRAARLAALAATVAALSLGAASCGDDDDESSGGGGGGGGTTQSEPAAAASKCGLGNGQKASGDPIKLGGLATKQPGVDFTQITGMAKAYFDCVNDNGGIHGRPIEYIAKTEQTNPQQVVSIVTKLWENDQVLGFVGNTSLLDCDVNRKFYEENDIYVILAGVPRQCFQQPNVAAVNMGPNYSALGAAQALVRAGAKSLVAITGKQPGAEYNNEGVLKLAKQEGIPGKSFLEPQPFNDGAALALKAVEAAGDDGGVVITAIAPEALKIMQGAEQQGLIDRVKWGCATPCNDASLAKAVGAAWNGKMNINAELNLVDTNGPDMQLYRTVNEKYGSGIPLGSFGQMGFLDARLATQALLDQPDKEYTKTTVNEAFRDIKPFKTDVLCKPWYFGKGDVHVPNNTDYTIVPQDGKFVKKEDCTPIEALPGNRLDEVRAYEKEQGIQ